MEKAANTVVGTHAITEQEIIDAQKTWADGIVAIGDLYINKGDYKARAVRHVKELYAYDLGDVLFKPTLASEKQFRTTFDEALSYFVGGHISEDNGFAIRPWSKVRFGEQKMIIGGDSAAAMGNYYFTAVGSEEETKVEYTFGYIKDADGKLRINIHHSSVPFCAD